jgi:hypothetical protein
MMNEIEEILDNSVWNSVEKDYEILEYRIPELTPVPQKEIYSVKRLSDGAVVSIDDWVEPIGHEGLGGKVTEFVQESGVIIVRFGSSGIMELKNAKKVTRKPILKSEDGVDMMAGDNCAYIYRDDSSMEIGAGIVTKCDVDRKYLLIFSSHSAAAQYRFDNIKLLSYNDVKSEFKRVLREGGSYDDVLNGVKIICQKRI